MVIFSDRGIQCVVVGDDSVGKTSMLLSYATRRFPGECVPPVFDNYAGALSMNGKQYHLNLLDTLEQEGFIGQRREEYGGTHVFVVCFSVVQPTSFKNVEDKWLPEIKRHFPGVPFIIVGTQADLRRDTRVLRNLRKDCDIPISYEVALHKATLLGASVYMECSPLSENRIKPIINKAIQSVLQEREKEETCVIL